jgi:hypothetical protein
MLEICATHSANAGEKADCITAATVYYQGVDKFGWSAFIERQLEVCSCRIGLGSNEDQLKGTKQKELSSPTLSQRELVAKGKQ